MVLGWVAVVTGVGVLSGALLLAAGATFLANFRKHGTPETTTLASWHARACCAPIHACNCALAAFVLAIIDAGGAVIVLGPSVPVMLDYPRRQRICYPPPCLGRERKLLADVPHPRCFRCRCRSHARAPRGCSCGSVPRT